MPRKMRQLLLHDEPAADDEKKAEEGEAGGSSSSAAEPKDVPDVSDESLSRDLRADEIDARAHIEAEAGLKVPTMRNALEASQYNRSLKEQLRIFWKEHEVGFRQWWLSLSYERRVQVLLSVGPHMECESRLSASSVLR